MQSAFDEVSIFYTFKIKSEATMRMFSLALLIFVTYISKA